MLRKVGGVAGEAPPAMGTRNEAIPKSKRRIGLVFKMLLAILAVFGAQPPTAVLAQNAHSWKSDGDRVRHVVITVYKSKTFQLDQPFSTAVVGSPEIADALPM